MSRHPATSKRAGRRLGARSVRDRG